LTPRANGVDWSSLHSSAAKLHAHNHELVSSQSKEIAKARIISLMQDITKCGIGNDGILKSYSSNICLAKQLANEHSRRLTPAELITRSLQNFWFDSKEVKIGNSFMHVDRYLLHYHASALKDERNFYLELPTHKVPINLLAKVYNWIVSDDYLLPLGDDFLAIYELIKFLDLRRILAQFWFTFSSSSNLGLWEVGAFKAYFKARAMSCSDMMSIFLTRIRKCFLPIVASIEFLEMDANELSYLFKLNTISVNSEDEIFFAAIHWLNYKWPQRKQYIVQLMKNVRFRLLSPWLQRSIQLNPENDVINEVGNRDEVRALLWDSCVFGAAAVSLKKFPNSCDRMIMHHYSQINEIQRFWVYCEGVPHHHDIKCPHFRPLTYKSFMHFLICLQSNGQAFMDTIKYSPEKQWNTYECCN
ncbi:hypothetical protein KR044_004882, partial [Drosophila immigrans]